MKRTLCIVLVILIITAFAAPSASAAYVSGAEAIETLEALNLVQGTGNGFEPGRTATRAEAAVMLLRLLGREQQALEASLPCPFTDAGWAEPYLAYAYAEGLIRGVSATEYHGSNSVSARDYLTMVLRALGYTDGEDFTWNGSLIFSDGLGLTRGEYSYRPDAPFLREDMALVSYTALTLCHKEREKPLIELLYLDGAITESQLLKTRLSSAVNAGKRVFSASEIYERCSSAVILVEAYETEEDLAADKPMKSGSGFLIRADGVAVMSYHQLEGASYATATMTDGRCFAVSGILYYQPERDVAVVRISSTDSEGTDVRFFPIQTWGDSDSIAAGEAVYTVSSPLGLTDTITGGLVSNRSRVVDDPLLPCIQFSAPISHGSSGGPLLNAYGEAIGVLYASYVNGQNLNLAVPLNSVREVDLDAEGVPLSEVCAAEKEKKASAQITAEADHLTLRVGEERDILISSDCPGHPMYQFIIDDPAIIHCEWQSFLTRKAVPIRVRGAAAGETSFVINFSDGYGNEDAAVSILVTVTE